MEQLINRISLTYSDSEINTLLKQINSRNNKIHSLHFSHNEELFLMLDNDYHVPSFNIHHDVNAARPEQEYLDKLKEILVQLLPYTSSAFFGLSYFFDSTEIFKPEFFRIFSIGSELYLYLLRIDISYRPIVHHVNTAGSNDVSSAYRSDRIYFESDFIPLKNVVKDGSRVQAFVVDQIMENTWAGERGRGYLTQGIWKDREYSKYFTKLFISPEKRLYPYYPYTCRFRTLCLTMLELSPEGRARYLPYLHRAMKAVRPNVGKIERDLSDGEFSENLTIFSQLKKKVPASWVSVWDGYSVTAYINAYNQKEFRIDFPHQ